MSHAGRRFYLVLPILGCFGGGSLYGWSGYLPSARASFGVSNADVSMVFSVALVSFTLGVLLGPAVLARIPGRFRLSALAGLSAFGLSCAASSTGFPGFVLCYGVCFGFTSGALYNHAISQASASKAAHILVPVSVAAFGLGGAVFGPLSLWLKTQGWALWSITPAMICLAMVAILALFIKASESDQPQVNLPFGLMKPDKTIAMLWLIFAAGSCSGLIVLGFASQIVPRGPEGFGLAGIAIFLAALGNTLGRLSAALISDSFGPARCIAGALLLSIGALVGLIFAIAPPTVVAMLFLVAFAYGKIAANIPLLVKSLVSSDSFSNSFGWVFTGWGVAGLIGPWTAGWLLDTTGTLQGSLVFCIALAAMSLWLVLRIAKPARAVEEC